MLVMCTPPISRKMRGISSGTAIVMVPFTFKSFLEESKFVMLIVGSCTVIMVPSGKLNLITPTRWPRIELGPDSLI